MFNKKSLFIYGIAIMVLTGCNTAKPAEDVNILPVDERISSAFDENTTISTDEVSENITEVADTIIEPTVEEPVGRSLSLEEFQRAVGTEKLEDTTGFTSKELSDMGTVNRIMEERCTGEEFENADLEERGRIVETCLKELEANGLVSNIHSTDDGTMYSFTYTSGVEGGWYLEDFDPYMN